MGACGCLFLFSPSHSAKEGEGQADGVCAEAQQRLFPGDLLLSHPVPLHSRNVTVVFHAPNNYLLMVRSVSVCRNHDLV